MAPTNPPASPAQDDPTADDRAIDDRTFDDRFAAEVVEPYERRLGALATTVLGSSSWAHDVVADVFVAVLPRWQRGSIDNLESYLYRSVVNRAKWYRRRQQILFATPPDAVLHRPTSTNCNPEHVVAVRLACAQALAKLPVRDRAVVALRYLEDLSEVEIAAVLGVPAGTVKSRMNRARKVLQTEMRGAL